MFTVNFLTGAPGQGSSKVKRNGINSSKLYTLATLNFLGALGHTTSLRVDCLDGLLGAPGHSTWRMYCLGAFLGAPGQTSEEVVMEFIFENEHKIVQYKTYCCCINNNTDIIINFQFFLNFLFFLFFYQFLYINLFILKTQKTQKT